MNFRVADIWRLLGSLLGTSLLGGCSLLPEAQADATRYYVLSASIAPTGSVAPSAHAPVVHLRPLEVASYIRARPMIVRRGDNELEFRDFARWGEPLEQGVARVIREELLASGAVSAMPGLGLRGPSTQGVLDLTVRVLACEGTANGGVLFRATWELTPGGEKAPSVARGDFRATDLQWDGKNEAQLAAQLSRAVAALAGEIVAGLARR